MAILPEARRGDRCPSHRASDKRGAVHSQFAAKFPPVAPTTNFPTVEESRRAPCPGHPAHLSRQPSPLFPNGCHEHHQSYTEYSHPLDTKGMLHRAYLRQSVLLPHEVDTILVPSLQMATEVRAPGGGGLAGSSCFRLQPTLTAIICPIKGPSGHQGDGSPVDSRGVPDG